MEGDSAPRAIAAYMFPDEDYDEILPGLGWDTYLIFAAHYYQIQWGILTNGLQLKIFNCENPDDHHLFFWPDLDGIVRNQKLDRFFTIYKVFSSIRNSKKGPEQSIASRQDLLLRFWRGLLEQAKTSLPRFSRITPRAQPWISTGAGKSGLGYSFVIRRANAQIELYIDQGDAKKNKHYFDELYGHRERIEKAFGEKLNWERLNDKRASRVSYLFDGFGLLEKDNWPELQKQMIEAMVRFQKAFTPEIKRLK